MVFVIQNIVTKTIGIFFIIALLFGEGVAQSDRFQGQGETPAVSTTSRPVARQWKGVFTFEETDIKVSNDFSGARLNGLMYVNDTLLLGLIDPENEPINMSPWYAFKIWAPTRQTVYIKLTYSGSAKHRYFPKYSHDNESWSPLDSSQVTYDSLVHDSINFRVRPENMTMKLEVGPDTLWVAGQELMNSHKVYGWMDQLATQPFVSVEGIGSSREGRPMKVMRIGNPQAKHHLMAISRQHPPEVTGYLAMQSFLETIAGPSELAKAFREKVTVFAVPLMNPDGVDNGHWRHNVGGIDLNRDWHYFNQPETRNVRDFMLGKVEETGGEFNFGIDFHSTWDDIYYTIAPEVQGNMPGIMYEWLDAVKENIPDYDPNISPNPEVLPTTFSKNFFYSVFGAEALVYEIGDDTDREFLKEKGKVGAEELMKIMLSRLSEKGE